MPSFRGILTDEQMIRLIGLYPVAREREETSHDRHPVVRLLPPAKPAQLSRRGPYRWILADHHRPQAHRILYAVSITVFFFIGGIAIGIVRLELFTPHGVCLGDDTYNRLFTLHGIVMVWFFLVPSIPATLGNFLLPLMIGARDVAFPRLNLF